MPKKYNNFVIIIIINLIRSTKVDQCTKEVGSVDNALYIIINIIYNIRAICLFS